jgi:UDP-N-acetylmuramate-alanine ligase
MSRGNPAVEHVLNEGLRYVSGPQWLAEHVLEERWVLAVAGTHGKTTTASMLAWILEHAGLSPGFLIGGVPEQLRRLGPRRRVPVLRDRGRRVRHGLLRQAFEVRALPAAHAW